MLDEYKEEKSSGTELMRTSQYKYDVIRFRPWDM
jgi:hypothetical protein